MAWDPTQYLKFGNQRLRPALDLLARVSLTQALEVVDLGCGAGNVTQALRARWPGAATHITGVDSSPEMLAQARIAEPSADWVEADIAGWRPPQPVDLIFSNAALHWLPDHATLIPHLMSCLKPGGVLALQMPNQTGAASHRAIGESIDAAPIDPAQKDALNARRVAPLARAQDYYDWVAAAASVVDQWETVYTHVLAPVSRETNAVAEWTRSTSLNPVLAALGAESRAAFWMDYCERMSLAYPQRGDGTTLFPFRRFFMVAERRQ